MKVFHDEDGSKIINGDAFEVLHDLSDLDGFVTDPPYSSGGAFRSDRTQQTSVKYGHSSTEAFRPEFSGDNRDQRSFLVWCLLWMTAAFRATKPGGLMLAFTDWRQLPVMTDAIQAGGWSWRGVCVWSKKWGRVFPGRFSSACEYVVWGSKGPMPEREVYPCGIKHTEFGDGPEFPVAEGDVFEIANPAKREHIAQKPVEVMEWLLSVFPRGATVCDPFMGSGTTLVAARRAGMKGVGIEVDARYCEVARKRLQQRLLFGGMDVAAESA